MELASSDAMAVRFALPVLHSTLSFLGRLKPFFSFWKRKKRMGSKTLPVCAERRQPPLGKGAFEWTESPAPAGVKVNFKSCKRADEYPRGAGRICNAPSSRTAALGIGPYKHERGAAKNRRGGRTGSSAPTRGAVVDSGRRADRVVRPYKGVRYWAERRERFQSRYSS